MSYHHYFLINVAAAEKYCVFNLFYGLVNSGRIGAAEKSRVLSPFHCRLKNIKLPSEKGHLSIPSRNNNNRARVRGRCYLCEFDIVCYTRARASKNTQVEYSDGEGNKHTRDAYTASIRGQSTYSIIYIIYIY